jgi:hypothetical protein
MQNDLNYCYFNGYTIIESEYCVDQVRSRKHKKRRIDKKWLKRYGYKYIPKKEIYVTKDKMIIGHPIVIKKLVESIKEQDNDTM